MPTDDLDIRTEPSLGDPQGMLSPSEKLDALFLALTDHINPDLSRKHGEDCELCNGVSTPSYLLPVPPALVIEVELSPASGRCVRCDRTRDLTHEVTGRSFLSVRGRWPIGSRVCFPCASHMRGMTNPYMFRSMESPATPSPQPEPIACGNCHVLGPTPYRIALDPRYSGILPVDTPLCDRCGLSMQPGGQDYINGWRSELIVPSPVATPAPVVLPTEASTEPWPCSCCSRVSATPARFEFDGRVGNRTSMRIGRPLCDECCAQRHRNPRSHRQ